MPVEARDISNHNGPLSAATVAQWRAEGVGLVLVQSLDRARFPDSQTRQQLQACADGGMPTDVYVYPFHANGVDDAERRLSEVDGLEHLVGRVWLDHEDVDPSQIDWSPEARLDMAVQWLERLDAFPALHGRPAGYYGAWWYWRNWLGWADRRDQPSPLADRDLWDADYATLPLLSLDGFHPYAGWTRCAIRQYGVIDGLDHDLVSDAEMARWQPAEVPCPELVNALGFAGGDLVAAFRAEANRRYGPRRAPILALADTLERTAKDALG